jgi:hypothetical protein
MRADERMDEPSDLYSRSAYLQKRLKCNFVNRCYLQSFRPP